MLVLCCNCWLAWRNGDRLGWLHSTLFMGGKLQELMFFNFGDKYIWYSDYFRHVLTTGIKLLPDITSALVLVQVSVTTGLCCWFSNQVCHMSLCISDCWVYCGYIPVYYSCGVDFQSYCHLLHIHRVQIQWRWARRGNAWVLLLLLLVPHPIQIQLMTLWCVQFLHRGNG